MKQISQSLARILSRLHPAMIAAFLSICVVHSVHAAPSQLPLFLTAPVKPILMLNMSNDHQLYYKVYDDYSDITGDGLPDTSYVHSYRYYGYFNDATCYVYQNGRFEPHSPASNRYCNGQWSGNFLNWATMTRIDVVRKILYGGYRQVDTAAETVLERSMLPNDAHSFAKYYNGTDINRLTPFSDITAGLEETAATGITICNTTDPSNRSQFSQNVTTPPLMRVARGNYSLWASNERWQCRWGTNSNGNDSAKTGIYAYSSSPNNAAKVGDGDYNVRVKACVADESLQEENCEPYGNNFKPRGLLQEYGRDDSMLFGLMTGSYVRNKSGGVLRKNVGRISDEISSDGTFIVPPSGGSIIRTLNLLRIFGYNFSDGIYNNNTSSGDNCPWAMSSFTDGRCSNWGNPQAEIYLESLRYLAGLSPNTNFAPANPQDSSKISGLPQASWSAPITQDNYCARASILQFNASTVSYDGDDLGNASQIGLASVDTATNYVGEKEGIHGGAYFVGSVPGDNDELCTPKTISGLASARGTCPEAPRLQGSYHIAGLAHFARREGIKVANVTEPKQVVTYGISLAPAVPRVAVPVPDASGNNTDRSITIQPACRNLLASLGTPANCAIVDFKVYNQKSEVVNGVHVNSGSLYVNWEDSEQGGDYDQDMWGIIKYAVKSNNTVDVTTQVMAQSTGDPMGFGYVISGTTDDNFYVHSGVNGFRYGPYCTTNTQCTCRNSGTEGVCDSAYAVATTKSFSVGASTAQPLKEPLYYAAKWGGYSYDEEKEALDNSANLDDMVNSRDVYNSYFYATDPWDLESSLRALFERAAAGIGVASSAATNSTRLTEGSLLYQAMFNSADWSGTLKAWSIDPVSKELTPVPGATTDSHFVVSDGVSIDSGRKIVTNHKGSTELVDFIWENLSDWQKEQLMEGEDGDASVAEARLNWIRGNRSGEGTIFRARKNLLGDIVNSNPAFSGGTAARYLQLPDVGGNTYRNYASAKPKVLYVGANDGMLHAIDADTFKEIFAYVPNGVYSKLANLSKPDYGGHFNAHQSLVDGQISVGDAYIHGSWRTVLVGALGSGGRSVFALDVTDPQAPSLLFEIDEEDYPGLGYVFGQPLVAPLTNGRWAAIFGNGAEAGSSRLFVVDLESPDSANTHVINTNAGTGLATPALRPNLQGQIEEAYAGDLSGNVWKFDLKNFTVAYGQPLFQARDANNNVQPITGGVTIGLNEKIKPASVMVYFGTGRYIYDGDNFAEATPVHSFYAIADLDPSTTPVTRANMHQKTMSGSDPRVISGERAEQNGETISLMDWDTYKGWYLDFNLIAGERVITKPVLVMDRLIFNTVIPSSIPCDYGGRSYAMELVAVGDKNIGHTVLGPNANTELDNLVVGEASVLSGKGGEEEGAKVDCDIKGNCDSAAMSFWEGWRGRMNWRQYR